MSALRGAVLMPYAPTYTIRDRSVPPPPVHWHLFENLPGPTLPPRKAGESMADYRRRIDGYDGPTGRRARPRSRARQTSRAGTAGSGSP